MSIKTPWLEVGPIHIILCVAEHERLSARRVPLVPGEAREIGRALLEAADRLEVARSAPYAPSTMFDCTACDAVDGEPCRKGCPLREYIEGHE